MRPPPDAELVGELTRHLIICMEAGRLTLPSVVRVTNEWLKGGEIKDQY